MIRTHLSRAFQARDFALLDAVLLAVRWQGPLTEAKRQAVLTSVLGGLELQGPRRELLAKRLEQDAGKPGPLKDEAFFASLRERLLDPRNRLLAFGLALQAATADEEHPGQAERLLSIIPRELGLVPSQVRDMRRGLAGGVSPAELAAEPAPLRHARVLETVLLSAGLEVHLSEAEVAALYRSREDALQLQELAKQLLRRVAFGSQVEHSLEAMHRQLAELALAPASLAQRREAWLLAVRFSHAIGGGPAQEVLLDLLAELLHIGDPAAVRASAPASART